MNPSQYVRFSFLARNDALSPEQFRHHYEFVHGPLASSLEGFRKYSSRYVQNHVVTKLAGRYLDIDGITATTQVPREDYRTGFFQEPDYAKVQPDEEYLFDLTRTSSVLGRQDEGNPQRGAHKLFALADATSESTLRTLLTDAPVSFTRLETDTASALGFGKSSFIFDLAIEAWFDDPEELQRSVDAIRDKISGPLEMWRIREVIMFPVP